MNNIIDACEYQTTSCINFGKVDDLVIQMVNDHYFDLQMYANFVFDIDNDQKELSAKNNFNTKIESIKNEYNPEFPKMKLFTKENMYHLQNLVLKMLELLKDNWITAQEYLSDITNMEFFGSGAASSAILLKASRILSINPNQKLLMPLIIKIIPFELPHHYNYLDAISPGELNNFIWIYIESPSYALFIKEAWMYCFSKNHLAKYTPTFTCISNCYFIKGLPIKSMENLSEIYSLYAQKRISSNKKLPYKKWFNILTNPEAPSKLKEKIILSNYGCFEMKQIEKTLDDILDEPGMFDLSIIFEYLYTKVVSAFIGRIIFTDDHFGNVAYITVDYVRSYNIKCNGCNYVFFMPAGKMVQFIDLERYIFNFSQYDIYTNTALKSIPKEEYQLKNKHLDKIRNSYNDNNYIFDKTLSALLREPFGEKNFADATEYKIMLQILTSPFVHDIKTFCQIMESNLPNKYLVAPTKNTIVEYFLDLDNESLRIININGLYNQIR
jgi:hypothetical protein